MKIKQHIEKAKDIGYKILRYVKNLLVSIDQLINTIIGGWPDETLSARAYRLSESSKWWRRAEIVINILFLNPRHCQHAFEREIDLPKDYFTNSSDSPEFYERKRRDA